MPFVTVGRENSAAIRIYYEDHGSGPPLVLVHGYALNGHSWEKQEAALLAAGHRVITYDRRGSGTSSRPSTGYDFDTLAADLHVLLTRLDLRQAVLAGFALGTGEVTRYLAVHGPARVKAAVLVAPLPPFPLKTHDNPQGIDPSVFDRLTAHVTADRPAAMKDFLDRSCNIDLLGGSRVSDRAWQNSFYIALSASAHAAPAASPPAGKTSEWTWPRSASPSWSSTATRIASCPTRPPARGFPRCWRTPAPPSTRAGRTRSSEPTPTGSTRRCSTSSPTRARPTDGAAARKTHRRADRRTGRPADLCRDRVSRPGIPHPAAQVGLMYDGELTGDLRTRQITQARSAPGHRRSPGHGSQVPQRGVALPHPNRVPGPGYGPGSPLHSPHGRAGRQSHARPPTNSKM
jgi:non-heme chloroperoxidase